LISGPAQGLRPQPPPTTQHHFDLYHFSPDFDFCFFHQCFYRYPRSRMHWIVNYAFITAGSYSNAFWIDRQDPLPSA
jgi:hypothetical protein